MRRLALLAVLVVCSVPATAAAQELTLFEDDDFRGARFNANSSVDDLARVGFNDRASSVIVRSGAWQLCADSYFRGTCITLQPGQYPSLGAMGLNDAVSSIREVGWSSGGAWPGGGPRPGPGPGPGGGGWSGGGSVVMFESPGLTGRSFTVNGPTPDLGGTGFNDRARSAIVNGGTWQFCADANYMSSCEVLSPGRYDDLGGVTGRVSSVRPFDPNVGGAGGPPPGPGGNWNGGGGWGNSARVVLYEGENFGGRAYTVSSNMLNNLADAGFNDRASSLRVERGYWMFCTDANFQGECRTFGPGDYPQLGWLSHRISSGRRISNDYPYNAPPTWR